MDYRESLIKLIKQECDNPTFGVEVGVHRGATSALLLQTFPSLTLAMVDLWGQWNDPDIKTPHSLEEQKQFRQQAMASTRFAGYRRWVILSDSANAAELLHKNLNYTDFIGESAKAARLFPKDVSLADFVFIDADHSYEACLRDMEAWWPVTKTLFCGHDYGKPELGVTQAVTEFCEKHGITVNVAEGHIWWINKLS